MSDYTAKVYRGDNPKWIIAECIETGTVSQGRTKEEALENLRILTKGHLEIVEKYDKILAERLKNNLRVNLKGTRLPGGVTGIKALKAMYRLRVKTCRFCSFHNLKEV